MPTDPNAPTGAVAARAAELLADGDVLLILADEQRAQAVAAALAAAAPSARALHLPSSDALPGDASPPTPANAGRRVAALHALHGARTRGERVALVTTAEACARPVAAPRAFDSAPPIVARGEPLDPDAFAAALAALGYLQDERVDEPGEYAARGAVIDVFPADADLPGRIELADGRVAAIRRYDPATLLGTDEIERLEVGRVSEPEAGGGAATLFDHLPGAAVLLDPDAPARRDRFVALATDVRAPAVDAAAWDAALAGRTVETLSAGESVPRFVEERGPQRAFTRWAKPLLDVGERVVLVGLARDLRFLSARARKALGRAPEPVEGWAAVMAAEPGSLLALAMPADRGWRQDGIAAVAAADLIGSRALLDEGHAHADPFAAQASEIRLGDVVVHEEFGLGVVQGLETLPEGDEAILIGYHGDDRRLVPVAEADRVWRYGADADAVTLDKLDGSS